MVIFFMELERKKVIKGKEISPLSVKDINIDLCNNYDYTLKKCKSIIDGYELVVKNKRNFK